MQFINIYLHLTATESHIVHIHLLGDTHNNSACKSARLWEKSGMEARTC